MFGDIEDQKIVIIRKVNEMLDEACLFDYSNENMIYLMISFYLKTFPYYGIFAVARLTCFLIFFNFLIY